MKRKLRAFLVPAILALALVGSAAFAQDEWPTFHQNNQRTGAVVNDPLTGGGVLGGFRPTPIWVFPAPRESMLVVDNAGADATDLYFTMSGAWSSDPLNAAGPFGTDDPLYYFTESDPTGLLTANWDFIFVDNGPDHDWRLANGSASFYVYIWVPSPGSGELINGQPAEHIRDAEYSVYVNLVLAGTYTLDQRSGGDWQLLTYKSFSVQNGDTLTVRLTNRTNRVDENDVPLRQLVIADAVMLRADAGIVYGSPVASRSNPILVSAKTENTVTWTTGSGATGTGVIYGLGTEPDSNVASSTDDRGVMVWRYPARDRDWIFGGITSSPAIMGTGANERAVVPGQDGQVYVVDTGQTAGRTATLAWSGPGYYVDDLGIAFSPLWNTQDAAFGRMGDRYSVWPARTPGSALPLGTATWTFTPPADPLKDREYDAYAWIPPPNGMNYLIDAKYSLLDQTGTLIPNSAVSVRQESGWVAIRKGYKVPKGPDPVQFGFQLTNETNSTNGDYYAVADAMKIVPSGLVTFDKSSPAVDAAGNIYVGSTDWSSTSKGRLYKLNVSQNDPVWIWPDQSQAPKGGFQGSPALLLSPNGDTVYIGSTDGRLYAVDANTGLKKWEYPDPSATPLVLLGEITGTPTVITGASGRPVIYIGIGGFYGNPLATSIQGTVLAIEDDGTQGTLLWQHPGPGADSLGAFDYVSAMLMGKAWGDPFPRLVIGSTDGKLYCLKSEGQAGGIGDQEYAANLADAITSSAAGTYINYAKLDKTPRTTDVPMAFVGAGSRIYGVDLTDGTKDWWWGLMGYTSSSPAVTNNRIYTGDWEGYTWAFSSGLPGGGGAETWNTTLGPAPPTPGSEGTGRDARPKVDIFRKKDWDDLHVLMETAENSGVPTDWTVNSDDLRARAMDYDNNRAGQDYHLEWGEDFYIVVWNLIDPNKKDVDPTKWTRRFKDQDPVTLLYPRNDDVGPTGFTENYVGKIVITIKNQEPGKAASASDTINISGQQIDFFNDLKTVDIDVGGVQTPTPGYACFYTAHLYTLDGSSGGKPQTPGSSFTITAREEPSGGSGNKSSLDIPVPKDPKDAEKAYLPAAIPTPENLPPLLIGINNPIGIAYTGPYPNLGGGDKLIGVEVGDLTKRDDPDAQQNGNATQLPPVIWGGYTPHNKLSDTRTLQVYDRSLLSMNGTRRITNFRIQRQDLKWTGGQARLINWLPWEDHLLKLGDFLTNTVNASDDYPDIDLRQIRCRLVTNGKDPTQGVVDLIRGGWTSTPAPAAGSQWNLNATPVNVAIQVPQFQPPNTDGTNLAGSGYTTLVYAYVDSNNNGVCDGLTRQGVNAIQQQKLTGGVSTEAHRLLEVQVHVPADYRARIVDTNVDIGAVPQGFGFTDDGAGTPQIFEPGLAQETLGVGPIAPPGFWEWFKPLNVRNIGNVNLNNVGFFRTDLYSDTVQQPLTDTLGNPIPKSGFGIPGFVLSGPNNPTDASCMVTTLDLFGSSRGPGFKISMPPVDPSLARTFHKERVGGDPEGSVLNIPDFPAYAPYHPLVQGPPAVSVAVPLGTPVGTYYGKMWLAEGGVSVSNTVDVIVTSTESRLTDGSTLPAPNLTHLDPTPPSTATVAQLTPTADTMPAAYRNPATGNMLLFWSSSRYPQTTVLGSATPGTSDPWYLYKTMLGWDPSHRDWSLKPAPDDTYQWWRPTVPASSPFPPPDMVTNSPSDFFPGSPADPSAGAPGDIVPGTVRFGSPSVAVDKINGQAYLMFTGQAYKDAGKLMTGGATGGDVQRRTLESRSYYTEINNQTDNVLPADIRSMSPNQGTTTDKISGDWTTPKFGVRGVVMQVNTISSGERDRPKVPDYPELWSFWYGGGNGKWRIYYNVKLNPSNLDPDASSLEQQWTNEALLPVPKCLSSVAEPSPVVHVHDIGNGRETGPDFEVVYSGVSNYHKNSDIFLSRYLTDPAPLPAAKGGSWPVQLRLLPQRGQDIPEILSGTSQHLFAEKLTRDATRTTWYSKDVDWLADVVSVKDATLDKPTSFDVYVILNPDPAAPALLADANDLNVDTIYQLNVGSDGSMIKDPSTGAIAYKYDANDSLQGRLKEYFRTVVINPVEGTVKFMRLPQKKMDGTPIKSVLVVANYYPKAYRLTTDKVADASPCALMDDDPNPRFGPATTDTDGLPFFIPGGASGGGSSSKVLPPPTDRLWVFWRRPTMDKPGTGIYYKAQRYMVQLDHQLGLNLKKVNQQDRYSPAIKSIVAVDGGTLQYPVEADWVKNRLYFTGADAKYTDPATGFPHLRQILVSYTDGSITDKTKNRVVDEPHYIQYADEDMAQTGKTFGNLTSLMVNEGQVNVIKDPGVVDSSGIFWPENRLWVFWSSTRSGNSDLYYETISPRFFGREYR